MKSLKLELFEYRKTLNIEQSDVVNIISEHMDLCDKYSEKEIYGSLSNLLDKYKFYEGVNTFLDTVDTALSTQPLLYNLKDLYAKVARKEYTFLYENALHSIIECINQLTDEDRKIKILNDLKLYEWIPEVKLFLYEIASTPQAKQNFASNGGKIDDVFSIVLQLKEGYLTYIANKWFLLNNDGITATLAENHISDDIQLKKLRLLEQGIQNAQFEENRIIFNIAEGLVVSFDTQAKKIYLNESEADKSTTLETLFNSPVIPFMGKAFYPILNETFNNLDRFMKIDTVKRVSNIMNTAYECFVFNYNGKISQYRVDKRMGNSYYTFENAMPLIEDVMHELGADLTFFYENQLSEEVKAKLDIEKKEKSLMEKLNDIDNGILQIKEEGSLLKENKAIESLYNSLLVKKHKVCEELKIVRNAKIKLAQGVTEKSINPVVIKELKAEIEQAKKDGDTEKADKLKNKLFTLTDGK